MGVSHAHPKANLAVANRRSAKVGLCKTAPAKAYFNFSLAAFDTTTTTSKVWSLYSFEGFLLYIRDIGKITKVTTFN